MENESENQQAGVEPIENKPVQNTIPKSKSKLSIILAVVLVFLILGGAGAFYLGAKNNPAKTNVQPTPTVQSSSGQSIPRVTIEPFTSWKTYSNYSLHLQMQYPPEYKIITESNNSVLIAKDKLGSGGIFIDGITSKNFIDYTKLKPCKQVLEALKQNPSERPSCLENEKTFGQNESIENVTVGGIDGKSFYVTYTGIGGTTHVIQVDNNPIIQIRPSDPGTSQSLFQQFLSTFKFTNQNQVIPTYSAPIVGSFSSPDGSFIVIEQQIGDSSPIIIKAKSGQVINDDLVTKNYKEIGYNVKFGCQCGTHFKKWTDNSHFTIQIANGIGEEYEYLVNAATGKVDESSFKRIK